jgi:hypothetical protein
MSVLSLIVAIASTKTTVGLAAAVLAVGAGAAAATAATGTDNPVVWGKTVTAAVATCKGQLMAAGQHGIGQCVSAVAKQKGAEERALHSETPGTHPAGNPSDVPKVKPSDVPRGKPSDVQQGKPSDLPHGRPTTTPPRSNGHPIGAQVSHAPHP